MARDMTYIDDVIRGIEGAIKYLFEEKIQIKNDIFNLEITFRLRLNNLLLALMKN